MVLSQTLDEDRMSLMLYYHRSKLTQVFSCHYVMKVDDGEVNIKLPLCLPEDHTITL
jgi:hypothetical protein